MTQVSDPGPSWLSCLRYDLCNASSSCFTTTWDRISNRLINKDLCRYGIFAHFSRIRNSDNLFPNKPMFFRVCSKNLLKTLWEKEELLVTGDFSFSHSVLYLFGEKLNYLHFGSVSHNPHFQQFWKGSPSKTYGEKEKMLVASIFFFSHNVFYPYQNKFQFFCHTYFVICKCFQFSISQKFCCLVNS